MASNDVPRVFASVLRILLIATTLAGVWLRFDGLARMPVWYDEVATLLHLSGNTQAQLGRLYDGRSLRVGELLDEYQGARSASTAPSQRPLPSVVDVVQAAAADEPQSGALYFAVASVAAGEGDAARVRLLSALASAASLLLLGLLAWRLFGVQAAWVVIAIGAISPLDLRFAQEARPYALCGAFLIASALAADRARRVRDVRAWIVYALCLSAALWSHPVALLAVPALFVLASARADERKFSHRGHAMTAAWPATMAAVVAWLPWAFVCWSAYPKIQELTAWSNEPIGFVNLMRGWVGEIMSLFFRPRGEGGILPRDFPEPESSIVSILLAGIAIAISAAALVAVARHPERPSRRFTLILTFFPWLVFVAMDLAFDGRRSTVARYLLPAWTGLQLAVACWTMRPGPRRRGRQMLLMLLLILGLATAWNTRTARGWWDTDVPRLLRLHETAVAIDAIPDAVVVTDMAPLDLLEFARHLRAGTSLRLGATAPASLTSEEWPRAVFVSPSPMLVDAMQKTAKDRGVTLERWRLDDEEPRLWRIAVR
ncbi:MAG TPA: glycosyltransferase family 39 protein [Rudaea sp.]